MMNAVTVNTYIITMQSLIKIKFPYTDPPTAVEFDKLRNLKQS